MSLPDLTDQLLKWKPSQWALDYRHIKTKAGRVEPYSFKGYEYLREIHDDFTRNQVGMKAAQQGWTEAEFNRVLHALDTWRLDVLYMMPTDSDAQDFSAGRFKIAYENSPRVQALFSEVDNVHHKRAGISNLYLRGGRSRSGAKSVAVARLVLDEFDEIKAEIAQLILDRVKGQDQYWINKFSTPTLPGIGIAAEYKPSDQCVYAMPCPHCGRHTWFAFDRAEEKGDTFVIACHECGKHIEEQHKRSMIPAGVWMPRKQNRKVRGRHLEGWYAPTVAWADLLTGLRAAEKSPDPKVLREYMNSSLGVPFVEKGYKLDQETLRRLADRFGVRQGVPRREERPVTVAAGVDSGVRGHYLTIIGIHLDRKEKAQCVKLCKSMDEVAAECVKHQAGACIIDAQPNTESSRKIQLRLHDKSIDCWLAYYSANCKFRARFKQDLEHGDIVVMHRTETLSETMGRLGTGDAVWAVDAPHEAFEHSCALRRVVEPDRYGNLTTHWVNDDADHYAHAYNYARMALEQVRPAPDESADQPKGFAGELAAEAPFG